MWWILSGLLALIVWALWLILSWPIWIPIVATSVLLVFVIALFVFRRIRARRAATALERAIAQQGAQQALNARPERRAEIQELQKQISGGINALKSSKLGSGRKGGSSALYQLPWYMIVGPPGAGKTTALKHSGLVFPYGDGGVRGVGGTRNCDWWFTNEAILLDTAGRYTTEQDDHDEWIAFLQMLRKYRSRRPINGVLVAISVAELIDANEQQLEVTGKKIRARIDEVITQLQMVVPVYVLFTKCDLIAGFIEFFGDLRKSDRAQAWGATLKLDQPKHEPGKIFEQEFDVLTKQIHSRALKRLVMERNREAREKVYQFPLEFAGIRRNLSELMQSIFAVNAFQGTPILRGFYFTSGTQEGRPLDRVLGRMGMAMGIRPPELGAQQVVESKSYFLHDVFMNVVFPDGSIAARTAGEIRRQQVMRAAISLAAFSLAMIAAIPSIVSFFNNRRFLRETEERVKTASVLQWADGRPASDKLVVMKPVLDRLLEIDQYRTDGVPFGMGWLMYQGETVYRPTIRAYVNQLQIGFVVPCKQRLEERLRLIKGDHYLKERGDLKKYLMLSDVEHLDEEWATGQFTSLWAELLRPTSNIPEPDLKRMLVGHVAYYFKLLKQRKVTPVPPNTALVEQARKKLMAVPVNKRYFDLFVNSVNELKYDEAGDNVRANMQVPPLTLGEMFADRPEVLKVLTSARFQKEKRWKEVEGPYTDKGHYFVAVNIKQGVGLLEKEAWVVPLPPHEAEHIPANMKHLADDYDQRYIDEWTDWMADLRVESPQTLKDAIDLYTILVKPDWPYLRILRALEDHTQWTKDKSAFENDAVNKELNYKIDNAIKRKARGIRLPNVDVRKLGDKLSLVPEAFKKTVEFGVPVDTRNSPGGSSGAPITDTPLAKYMGILSALKDDMVKQVDQSPTTDARVMNDRLAEATSQANALVQPFDDKAKQLLTPLLLDPLKIVGTTLPAGGAQRVNVATPRGLPFGRHGR
ncbi:MAG TPA: type VI secretion system membrane subunit TssM [Minicystis sp.]|nr:type VI secretion system membrane subunit TssM [Minicystis sp.]